MLGTELGNAGAECNLAFSLCLRWDLCVSEGGFLICSFGCVSEERETSVKILRNLSASGDNVPLACSVKQLQQPETKIMGKNVSVVLSWSLQDSPPPSVESHSAVFDLGSNSYTFLLFYFLLN